MKHLLLSVIILLCLTAPSVQAQWVHTPIPDGAEVYSMKQDQDMLYVFTVGGIFKSSDEGYHWQHLPYTRNILYELYSVQISKGVFYATRSSGSSRVLVRSRDEGKTWQVILQKPLPITAPGEELRWSVFVKGDTVLMQSVFTIYRSTDGGDTWSISSDLFGIPSFTFFSAEGEFFAWSNRWIYRSSDGGQTWQEVFKIATDFSQVGYANGVWLAMYNFTQRVVRSTDGWRTWEFIETDSLYDGYGWIVGDGKRIYSLQYGLGCNSALNYSDDAGKSWHCACFERSLPFAFRGVAVIGDHLVLAYENGIAHSRDQLQTFSQEQAGLQAYSIRSLAIGETRIAVSTAGGIWVSDKDSISWASTDPLPHADCRFDDILISSRRRWLFRGRHGQFRYFSEDEGRSWNNMPEVWWGEIWATEHCIWNKGDHNLTRWRDDEAIAVNMSGEADGGYAHNPGFQMPALLVDHEDYLSLYHESGQLASTFPSSPCNTLLPGAGPRMKYYTGQTPIDWCGDRAFVYLNANSGWTEIYPQNWLSGVPLYHYNIPAVAVYKGITWLCAEGLGIVYSTDASGRFYPLHPPLPSLYPTAIRVRDDTLWVGTKNDGLYHLPLPPVHQSTRSVPAFHCSPNPSTGILHLTADAFLSSESGLDLYDVSGKQLLAQTLPPGYVWDFDLAHLPKGLYLLRLHTDAGSTTLKWVLH